MWRKVRRTVFSAECEICMRFCIVEESLKCGGECGGEYDEEGGGECG